MLKGDINTPEFEHLDCKKKKISTQETVGVHSVGTWAGIWLPTVASNQTLKELAGFIKEGVVTKAVIRNFTMFLRTVIIYVKQNLVHWFYEIRGYELS